LEEASEDSMKVRIGSMYIYSPNGLDTFRACQGNSLQPGQIVRVISLPGAPKANTMGQCYVGDRETGKFICMVSTGSLEPVNAVINRLKAQLATMEAA
jgi:hypothetical protein